MGAKGPDSCAPVLRPAVPHTTTILKTYEESNFHGAETVQIIDSAASGY